MTSRQIICRLSRHLLLVCGIFSLCGSSVSAKSGGTLAPVKFTTVEVHDPLTGRRLGQAHPSIVIVQFSSSTTMGERAAIHSLIGAAEYHELGAPGLVVVRLPPGVTPDMALKHYASQASVRGAYPDFLYHVFKVPNDPLASQQYALSQINAFSGWEFETGYSSPVTVAIMDTGVDRTHPEFRPLSSVSGANFKYDDLVSQNFCSLSLAAAQSQGFSDSCTGDYGTDIVGHGTEVAGVAAATANNSIGISGMSWGAKIVSLRVFTDQGDGDDSAIIAALNYAATLTANTGRRTVVNMSLGECPDTANSSSCGECNAGLSTAIANALAANVVLIAAAGNLDPTGNPFKNVTCPAKITGVVAVGATDSNQSVTSYSGQGATMTVQGVVAPGDYIETTEVGGSYAANARGTSFASPHVAGLAALILSAKPAYTPAQMMTAIRSSAESIGYPSTQQGAGRVNAFLALRLAVEGTLSTFDGTQKAIAFPNPFRPSVNGNVSIAVPGSLAGTGTQIKIYTIGGRLVRTLSGSTWDGKNDQGTPVATGTYVFFVSTSNGQATGKLALIR